MKTRLGGWKKNAVRLIVNSFLCAEYSYKLIYLVIIRSHVIIADRPIIAKAVNACTLEIVGAETKGNASPMVCPATHHARSKPVKFGLVFMRIGLAIELPSAVSSIKIAKIPLWCAGPSPGRFPGPFELGLIYSRVVHGARFEQRNL